MTFWSQHGNEAEIVMIITLYLTTAEQNTLQKYPLKAFNDHCLPLSMK